MMRWLCILSIVASMGGWIGPAALAQTHDEPAATATSAAAVHEEEAPEAGEGRELVQPVISEAVYTIIVFLIFFSVLSMVVWPKILASLQAREQKQQGDLKQAEDAARDAQTTLEQYRQQLAAARQEAQQIIEQSRSDAQKLAAQLKKDAEAEMAHMRQRAETDIRSAGEQAIASIYEQAAGLSTAIAGHILHREIDPAAHKALVEESLRQIDSQRN